MSEFRRDAAIAVSNAATAAERLLSEPVRRRGNVEASLTAVNYCRQILHALAAISDYPAREPLQLQSGDLTKLLEALAKALDDLATSLEAGVTPGRLPDLSALTGHLEESVRVFPEAPDAAVALLVKGPKRSETGAWLFYHLKNVSDLTLAAREVASRLLRAEVPSRPGQLPQALSS